MSWGSVRLGGYIHIVSMSKLIEACRWDAQAVYDVTLLCEKDDFDDDVCYSIKESALSFEAPNCLECIAAGGD